ncbi:nucleotidyltransferase domain-containing protein [Polaromonas sp. P1-6]|nr:nucleotidyltransferase domain-containing protein [Polaromonas sp. P1-6]UUZ67175.1 nucleotidyltransferase domain-containing protein [Polaromonas sp. P2-4]
MTSIAHYLLGQTRSSVLSALFLYPDKSLHVRELARVTGASPGSLHRELRALAELGLLLRQEVGRQVHYQANPQCPVFNELAGLLRKTAGVADVLRDALVPLGKRVALAFVYGSVVAGTERSGSDVDVMLLGSAGFADVALALAQVQATLGREVNPTPMSTQDFARKLAEGDGFARSVAASPKIWLIGGEDDFAKLVAHRQAALRGLLSRPKRALTVEEMDAGIAAHLGAKHRPGSKS